MMLAFPRAVKQGVPACPHPCERTPARAADALTLRARKHYKRANRRPDHPTPIFNFWRAVRACRPQPATGAMEDRRETDLSAEQAGAQAPPRLPRPHGNGRRPQGHRRPPPARPQAPVGLRDQARAAMGHEPGADAPATSLGRLKKRREFKAAAAGRRVHLSLLSLQAGPPQADRPQSRVGLTVTRKEGTAVERNRIRRRLREALRQVDATRPAAGHDYVIIARRAMLSASFPRLVADLDSAFARVHTQYSGPREPRRGAKPRPVPSA
jgi:ribonuclease P protein component